MDTGKTIKEIYSKMCVKNEIQQLLLCDETNGLSASSGSNKTVLEINESTHTWISNVLQKY